MTSITKKLNILYAEDDITINESLTKLLKLFFNNVTSTLDGQEALDCFLEKENQFDLLITDIRMPRLDGIELIEEIRKIDTNINIIFQVASMNTKIKL